MSENTRACFIDEKGGAYKRESLKQASKDLALTTFNINSEEILVEIIRWQLNNFFDFIVHFKKVRDVDLEEPIILRSDGYVMDGWHRIIKAMINGKSELPAKQFMNNPKPDFKINI